MTNNCTPAPPFYATVHIYATVCFKTLVPEDARPREIEISRVCIYTRLIHTFWERSVKLSTNLYTDLYTCSMIISLLIKNNTHRIRKYKRLAYPGCFPSSARPSASSCSPPPTLYPGTPLRGNELCSKMSLSACCNVLVSFIYEMVAIVFF